MRRVQRKLRPKRSRSGQAILEYLLILSMALVFLASFSRGARTALISGVQTFGGQLERDLKTGRISADVWSD